MIIKKILFIIATIFLFSCNGDLHIEKNNHKKRIIDSLRTEFNKADSLASYYNMMQDLSGGVLENSEMWWLYRDSTNRAIDKMIQINKEIISIRDAH